MKISVYLRLSILELNKILIHKFRYAYVKLKYDEKVKMCYMVTERFTVYINTRWYLWRYYTIWWK